METVGVVSVGLHGEGERRLIFRFAEQVGRLKVLAALRIVGEHGDFGDVVAEHPHEHVGNVEMRTVGRLAGGERRLDRADILEFSSEIRRDVVMFVGRGRHDRGVVLGDEFEHGVHVAHP